MMLSTYGKCGALCLPDLFFTFQSSWLGCGMLACARVYIGGPLYVLCRGRSSVCLILPEKGSSVQEVDLWANLYPLLALVMLHLAGLPHPQITSSPRHRQVGPSCVMSSSSDPTPVSD